MSHPDFHHSHLDSRQTSIGGLFSFQICGAAKETFQASQLWKELFHGVLGAYKTSLLKKPQICGVLCNIYNRCFLPLVTINKPLFCGLEGNEDKPRFAGDLETSWILVLNLQYLVEAEFVSVLSPAALTGGLHFRTLGWAARSTACLSISDGKYEVDWCFQSHL